MTRKKIFAGLKDILLPTDIVFCVGKYLCREAPKFNNEILFFENENIDLLSVVLGLSSAVDHRVIILIEDNYMLKYFSSMLQLAVSKNRNLHIFVITTGVYVNKVKQPNIYNSLKSIKGTLFNSGFIVHDYTKYLEDKSSVKKLKNFYKSVQGPMVSLIKVTNNRLYNKEMEIEPPDFCRLNKFVLDSIKETFDSEDKNKTEGDNIGAYSC